MDCKPWYHSLTLIGNALLPPLVAAMPIIVEQAAETLNIALPSLGPTYYMGGLIALGVLNVANRLFREHKRLYIRKPKAKRPA